jgi:hypothetical protein
MHYRYIMTMDISPETENEKIPPHRRWGLRFLQVLIIIMAFALIRNCILISTNSNFPGTKLQLQYYDKGYEAGREKAQDNNPQIEDPFPNLILEKTIQRWL